MHSSLALLSALSLAAASSTAASPAAATRKRGGSFEVPIMRRNAQKRSGRDLVNWAKAVRVNAHRKYGMTLPPSRFASSSEKRASSGPVQLFDISEDSEYVGFISVGTPAVSHLVILDTGSSDLWLASSDCTTGCNSAPTYDPSSSSTSQTSSSSFQVEYGSGAVQGTLAKDAVGIAGMSTTQEFGVADKVSAQMLQGSISGLLGLGWEAIASSGATPLVQALWQNGDLDSPVMQFALTRFIDVRKAKNVEPGGVMSLGTSNTTLYTGSINYVSLSQKSYWLIPLDGVQVGGTSVAGLTSGADAAIDTGTSLVGAPTADVAAIYAQIPGAAASTESDLEGYWTYPCSSSPSVALTFGGVSYAFNSDDWNLGEVSSGSCVGAIFELGDTGAGSSTPSWIAGDAFLKSVVTTFQFSPAAVGFATPNEDTRTALADDTAATKGLASITAQADGAEPSGAGSGGDSGSFPSSASRLLPASVALAACAVAALLFT